MCGSIPKVGTRLVRGHLLFTIKMYSLCGFFGLKVWHIRTGANVHTGESGDRPFDAGPNDAGRPGRRHRRGDAGAHARRNDTNENDSRSTSGPAQVHGIVPGGRLDFPQSRLV